MSTATLAKPSDSAIRLFEMRRHQVYRLERRRSRSLLSRLGRGLRARLHR